MRYQDFESHIKNTMHNTELPLDITALITNIHAASKPVVVQKSKLGSRYLLLLLLLTLFTGLAYRILNMNSQNPKEIPAAAIFNLNEENQTTDAAINESVDKSENTPTADTEMKTVKADETSRDPDLAKKNESRIKTSFSNRTNEKSKKYVARTSDTETAYINSITKKINAGNSAIMINDGDNYTITENSSISNFTSDYSIAKISGIDAKINYSNAGFFGPGKGRSQIGCPTFDNSSGVRFEIIPEIGYFRPLKRLSNSGTEPSDVFTLRDRDEKSLEGLQAALYGRMSFKSVPLYLQAGVYYSRMTEQMNLKYSYTRLDTTQGIISITRSPSGDTITTIYGDIVTETKVSGESTAHHYFSLLDIPVSVGYEMYAGRFIVGIEGGLMFNVFMKSQGRLLNTTTTFEDLENVNPYKSGVGLSYFGSVSVGTHLGPGRIYLAARYRHIPNDFTEPGAAISQGYSQAGLHLGYIIPLQRSGLRVL
ncbi:MAG: hypothetical protein IPM42_19440 [Saprospiraceae bacterium]|nr:hypothetical protein [Saprospiraceae bacterium]